MTRDDLLAIVERSPIAAAARDRDAWVGAFTADGTVEDPVGSRPHRGRRALERFYDTFIGPRDITFHPDVDVVSGHTVMRDLDLEVGMSPTVTMRIPAYLRYDVDTDTMRIARLQAHWELPSMAWQFARSGPAAVPVGLRLGRSLLGNQGPTGAAGFLKGAASVGNRGKRHVIGLLQDARAGNELAVRRRLGDRAVVTSGDDSRLGTSELAATLAGARWQKVIAAGRTVTVGLDHDGRRSVLLAQLGTRPTTIARLRLFGDR